MCSSYIYPSDFLHLENVTFCQKYSYSLSYVTHHKVHSPLHSYLVLNLVLILIRKEFVPLIAILYTARNGLQLFLAI